MKKKSVKKVPVAKKTPVTKTVTVKIIKASAGIFDAYQFSELGKQVEMKDKDENYIKKAFTQMRKAQEILKNYYEK